MAARRSKRCTAAPAAVRRCLADHRPRRPVLSPWVSGRGSLSEIVIVDLPPFASASPRLLATQRQRLPYRPDEGAGGGGGGDPPPWRLDASIRGDGAKGDASEQSSRPDDPERAWDMRVISAVICSGLRSGPRLLRAIRLLRVTFQALVSGVLPMRPAALQRFGEACACAAVSASVSWPGFASDLVGRRVARAGEEAVPDGPRRAGAGRERLHEAVLSHGLRMRLRRSGTAIAPCRRARRTGRSWCPGPARRTAGR